MKYPLVLAQKARYVSGLMMRQGCSLKAQGGQSKRDLVMHLIWNEQNQAVLSRALTHL